MKWLLNYNTVLTVLLLSFCLVGCKSEVQKKELPSHEESTSSNSVSNKVQNKGIEKSKISNESWHFNYDLSKPEKCSLPKELIEISALSIDPKHDVLYAVNDEKALLFAIENCEIVSKFDFGKNADYEGVELVGNDAYILKSNGKLIKYDVINAKVLADIKTPLKTDNDAEGLGYDKEKNMLLIACKGSPNLKRSHKYKKSKAIYAYDIENDVFIDKPLFVINDNDIESFLSANGKKNISKKAKKSRKRRALRFSPAAISKSLTDNNYYILSTVGKVLMIVNSKYEIIDIKFLDHPSFIQPEGICFNSAGDLLISNEGKGLVANILSFPRFN